MVRGEVLEHDEVGARLEKLISEKQRRQAFLSSGMDKTMRGDSV